MKLVGVKDNRSTLLKGSRKGSGQPVGKGNEANTDTARKRIENKVRCVIFQLVKQKLSKVI